MHLNPLPVVAHQGDVQGLVAVGFGMADPVAQAVGVGLVYLGDGDIDVEAVVQLLFHIARFEDDAYGKQVIDFLERYMLGLHLVPDGIDGFYPGEDTVFQAHLIQLGTYRGSEVFEYLVTLNGGGFQLLFYFAVFFGVFVFETQVLKLGLYLV